MNSRTYHFISGLPRSGSNLLAALLVQNPNIHAGMTSPVMNMISMLTEAMRHKEDRVWFDDDRRSALVRGLFDNFYYDKRQSVIIDTNRLWPSYSNMLVSLFPDHRMIVCVREVEWVMDSLEVAYQRNKFRGSAFDFPRGAYDRCAVNVSQEGPLGRAMHALREGVYGPYNDRMLFVRYNTIADSPQYALDCVYDFIGVERYRHHYFEGIEWDAGKEYDTQQGLPGLHDVRPLVKRIPRKTILPPDLFEQYKQYNFWDQPGSLPDNVRVV